MIKIEAATRLCVAKDWSSKVTKKVKKHPPEGLFTKSAGAIAEGLKALHGDLQGAMGALNFYVNRAGSNLSEADKKKMEQAKKRLHDLYGAKDAD